MTRSIALLLILSALAGTAAAQQTSPLIRYGKWVLLAGSLGMNYLAADAHHQADRAFDQIRERCGVQPDLCALDPAGRYQNAEMESLYQRSLHFDRRARGWLFGGEAALLGAGAMFVWELTRPKGPPENIPFQPEVSVSRRETRLGFQLRF